MNETHTGRILAIAVRAEQKGPMRELAEAFAVADAGLAEDIPKGSKRGVTFLEKEQWAAVLREVGVDLPWLTRRANVLVEGVRLGELIGKSVRAGEAELVINGETRPCELMDAQYDGLQAALRPDCRAGVYGRVTKAGHIRVGDRVSVLDSAPGAAAE